jgi:hypothetical protein
MAACFCFYLLNIVLCYRLAAGSQCKLTQVNQSPICRFFIHILLTKIPGLRFGV